MRQLPRPFGALPGLALTIFRSSLTCIHLSASLTPFSARSFFTPHHIAGRLIDSRSSFFFARLFIFHFAVAIHK